MKIVAIVQARMGSGRLPGKVLKSVNDFTIIELILARLQMSKRIDEIIVATSDSLNNKPLIEKLESLNIPWMQGPEHDVLDRYMMAAKISSADVIVRITGDCPFIDPIIVDQIIDTFLKEKTDYVSNTLDPTFPDGLDTEVFSMAALTVAYEQATSDYDREHVTPFIKNSKFFNCKNFSHSQNFSSLRWTVDEVEDFEFFSALWEKASFKVDVEWLELLDLCLNYPELNEINSNLIRNEGASMSLGQKVWRRARKSIAGGNMLLSKRPDMLLPGAWPTYFEKAKGVNIWDLDGNKYVDMGLMGVGTNILGYSNDEVDSQVIEVAKKGNMSTLNCLEEVLLAEKMLQLDDWADQVKFCRTGGEANAVAVRLARAKSGKERIAFCGYHGWHDWYLASNLTGDNLAGHHLQGLDIAGVPSTLANTAIPFTYNNFDQLNSLSKRTDIGAIIMEVSRNKNPKEGFLEEVVRVCRKQNIVLIFDECSSGFRQNFGGLHKEFNVEPDIAVYGKALGNGYAITAVVGRKSVMNYAQETFISSTFWTERIGPTAALKTLEIMEDLKSWKTISNIGQKMWQGWKKAAEKNDLDILISGIPGLSSFTIESNNWLKYKTLITQEFLKKNILATNSFYPSICHLDQHFEEYFSYLDDVFELIAECETGRNIDHLLREAPVSSGFQRLN